MNPSPYRDHDHSFGQLMLTLRTATGLNQTELGDMLGVSRRTVGAWESGSKYPNAEHLRHFITLAAERKAFSAESAINDVRSLWKSSRVRLLLDENWLTSLLTQHGYAAANPVPIPAAPADPRPKRAYNLPHAANRFVGRSDELAEIARLLHDPNCRLLTLLGPGGIGKTRLALEIAAGQIDTFADGVAFVPLASVSAPDQIVAAIGDALDLSFAGQSNPRVHLLSLLRNKYMLLVLDNFEHLIEGAELVLDILERAPNIVVLATSRERLNLRPEWLYDVQGLSYPTADSNESASAKTLADYSAIELFTQRAAQIQSGIPPSAEAMASIVRICQHVAGMPLAIELAAAGVRVLPIARIEQQIRANLDTLSTTLRDVPARHRSLRAVFDHSWNLLSEPERALFTRLAVFRGGCTAEAAEQVAGASLSALLALVDKSLLRQETIQLSKSGTEEMRFWLLEPLREYALEKLTVRGERENFQHAHAAYYLSLTRILTAQWDMSTAEAALEQLDYEHDNLFAVHFWAKDGGDRATAFDMGSALARYWRNRGWLTEGRVWMRELLAQEDVPSDRTVMTARMHAARWAAWLASDQLDFGEAGRLLEHSSSLRQSLGEAEDENETNLLIVLALQARATGQYRRAERLGEAALDQHRKQGNLETAGNLGLGLSLQVLGGIVREQANFPYAEALYQECYQLHHDQGDREGMVAALLGLGDIRRDQGLTAESRPYAERTLAFGRELGMQWAIGFSLNNLAQLAYLDGDLAQAAEFSETTLTLFREIDLGSGLAEMLVTWGHIRRIQGDITGAYEAFSDALRRAQIHGPHILLATALEGLAGVVIHTGQAALTAQILSTASALRARMEAPLRPIDQLAIEYALSTAQAMLGETTFGAIWSEAAEQPFDTLLDGILAAAIFTPQQTDR